MVSRRRARRKEPEEEQPKAGNENVGEEEDEQPKAGNEDTGEEKVKLLAAQSMPVRMRNFAVRLIWTLVMLAAFAWLVSLGIPSRSLLISPHLPRPHVRDPAGCRDPGSDLL